MYFTAYSAHITIELRCKYDNTKCIVWNSEKVFLPFACKIVLTLRAI